MTFYICKMCGRGMRAEEKPNFCYADHVDAIENISDEDGKKIGFQEMFCVDETGVQYEFPGDIKWDPFTGKRRWAADSFRLEAFQKQIMQQVTSC